MIDICDVIERERDLGGYFAIVTSENMTAKEALELYKSRDASEKLFKGDKTYPLRNVIDSHDLMDRLFCIQSYPILICLVPQNQKKNKISQIMI